MAEKELLPCPLCGSNPTGPEKPPFSGSDERCGYNFVMRITCRCGLTLEKASRKDKLGWCIDTGEARAAAVSAWNTRKEATNG